MIFLLVLVLFYVLTSGSGNILTLSDPTPEEIQRGFEVLPLDSWGYQARSQNSLRILCVGGSNTAHEYFGNGYVNLLNDFLKDKRTGDEQFRNRSYALNFGRSGFGLRMFLGRSFLFEYSLEEKEWPNVVIIDCTVNGKTKINTYETFIRYIMFKYKLRGLPSPDFMFYNMPHLDVMFIYALDRTKPAPDRATRIEYIHNYTNNAEYFVPDPAIRELAGYYHLPVISWGNATYSAAMRHFTNSSFAETPWRYSEDGRHMSGHGGTKFGMEKLLAPFFRDVLKPRKEVPFVDLANATRYCESESVRNELVSYNCYPTRNMFALNDIIEDIEHSPWQLYGVAHSSRCFCSQRSNEGGPGVVKFPVPKECNKIDCHVQLGFLHSWNTSFIGNASCEMFKHKDKDKDHHGVHVSSFFIDGLRDSQRATIPVMTEVPVPVTEGIHSVKCKNLVDKTLTCMVEVAVRASVTV